MIDYMLCISEIKSSAPALLCKMNEPHPRYALYIMHSVLAVFGGVVSSQQRHQWCQLIFDIFCQVLTLRIINQLPIGNAHSAQYP